MSLREPFFLCFLVCLHFLSVCINASFFEFPDFSNVVGYRTCERSSYTICLQGDAAVLNDGTISLTDNDENTNPFFGRGRASYSEPLLLYTNTTGELTRFSTTFSLQIDTSGQPLRFLSDAITFFLAPYPSQIPEGSGSKYMGLWSYLNKGNDFTRPPFVAVEFDSSCDTGYDPDVPHMGIDINNISSVKYANITDYLLKAGAKANVTVAYNGRTHNLSAELVYDNVSVALWYVVDLKQLLPQWVSFGFSAGTSDYGQRNKIYSWRFNTSYDLNGVATDTNVQVIPNSTYQNGTLKSTNPHPHVRASAILVAVGGIIVLVLIVLFGICIYWKRKRASILENDNVSIIEELGNPMVPERFPYHELARATNNFSEEKKLGSGGFGAVYHGFLANREVAIKKISKDSGQGKKEYISEIKAISHLRHRNLVRLVGWCHQNTELLLIYEFMPNGSLDKHLFSMQRLLSWPLRYKIALGLASALLYLQEEWEKCVLHRDIKSSNVLLDSAFNAKLGDFGLARITDHESTLHTTFCAGTMGYLAPECLFMGKGSKESDVYSFGIVALEIACGRMAIEPQQEYEKVRLANWVWRLYGNDELLEAADKRLNGVFDIEQIERLMLVGMWCAHPDLHHRPSMKQVVRALNFEIVVPQLPSKMPEPVYSSAPPAAAQDATSDVSNTTISTSIPSSTS